MVILGGKKEDWESWVYQCLSECDSETAAAIDDVMH